MGKNLRLRDARREKGLTQQALAEAVGVTRQTIHAVESGEYNPTPVPGDLPRARQDVGRTLLGGGLTHGTALR